MTNFSDDNEKTPESSVEQSVENASGSTEPYPFVLSQEPPLEPTPEKTITRRVLIILLILAVLLTAGIVGLVMSRYYGSQNNSIANTALDRPLSTNKVEASDTVTVANDVLPKVVSIQLSDGSSGSGTIISSDGQIMTNNHVIEEAKKGTDIQVTLTDGRTFDADVIASDAMSDVAVIKAKNASNLPVITFANSDDVEIGEQVLAVGSPLGLDATVTTGIISAVNRPVQAGNGGLNSETSVINALQTDAAINPGNSGGALVNMRGELVGIPSVIATMGMFGSSGSIGLGFAVPSNQAHKVAVQLIENGSVVYPMIGATVNTASQDYGAEIMAVSSGSPAEKAGLKVGDVITSVNGKAVTSGQTLISIIHGYNVGDTVKVTYEDKNDNEKTVDVVLAQKES